MQWYYLLSILMVHYIADFWVQTHVQSQDKSVCLYALTGHVITYSLCWIPLIWVILAQRYGYSERNLGSGIGAAAFAIIFVGHWLTDFITSRAAKQEFGKPNGSGIRTGFQIVGFDQMIHYVHLYLVFYWLLNL